MNRAELKEIRFDLPPRQPGGNNRVSFISIERLDGGTRQLTFAEPLRNTRTIRDECYTLHDGKQILTTSQFFGLDSRTGKIDLKKIDLFTTSGQIQLTYERRFNNSGQLFKESVTFYNSCGGLRYNKMRWFDWETCNPIAKMETYFGVPLGSVELMIQTYDPLTKEVTSEEQWVKVSEGIYQDKVSGRCVQRLSPQRPLRSYLN